MENNLQYTQQTPAATAAGDPAEVERSSALPPPPTPKAKTAGEKHGFWHDQWKRIKKYRKLLWFLIPAAAFTLVFSYVPMLGILFSFKGAGFDLTRGDILFNLTHGDWTIQNYLDIFVDTTMFHAVGNTLLINVIRLALCFPLSIVIAVMLSELKNQTFSKVILIIITIPNFLSWAIVIGIWSGFLHPDTGFFGKALTEIGIVNIMAQESWFKPLVIFLSAWKGAGWGCILFYSAIMSIDKTYYESATLEGANKLQKMWYLTLPSILPTIALMLVLNIAGMMAVGFEQVWTMMQADASLINSQITLDTYIYRISNLDASNNVPFATALGVFNGIIGLVLMLVGNAITTKTLKRGLW